MRRQAAEVATFVCQKNFTVEDARIASMWNRGSKLCGLASLRQLHFIHQKIDPAIRDGNTNAVTGPGQGERTTTMSATAFFAQEALNWVTRWVTRAGASSTFGCSRSVPGSSLSTPSRPMRRGAVGGGRVSAV
jgi:hypothetical protein